MPLKFSQEGKGQVKKKKLTTADWCKLDAFWTYRFRLREGEPQLSSRTHLIKRNRRKNKFPFVWKRWFRHGTHFFIFSSWTPYNSCKCPKGDHSGNQRQKEDLAVITSSPFRTLWACCSVRQDCFHCPAVFPSFMEQLGTECQAPSCVKTQWWVRHSQCSYISHCFRVCAIQQPRFWTKYHNICLISVPCLVLVEVMTWLCFLGESHCFSTSLQKLSSIYHISVWTALTETPSTT